MQNWLPLRVLYGGLWREFSPPDSRPEKPFWCRFQLQTIQSKDDYLEHTASSKVKKYCTFPLPSKLE